MIEKIEYNQPLQGASSIVPNAKKAVKDNEQDVTVNVDYSTLIDKAIQSSQEDSQLIEKARESIRTGEIDSFANIREAAKNMFSFGI